MVNIATDPIWRVSDSQGQSAYISLTEMIFSDRDWDHAPPVAALSVLQHELLASVLQVAIDTLWAKGMPKHEYRHLLMKEQAKEVRNILKLIKDVAVEMPGLNLFGEDAFMQVPESWALHGKKMDIASLMTPFIPQEGSQAKGLRRMVPTPKKIGPDLTALYLFGCCTLSKGGLQYWTPGNMANRTVAHLKYGKTLRQRLFASVLPGFSSEWRPKQPLAWVEEEQHHPLLRYVLGPEKIRGTCNIRFYLSRAIRLDLPTSGNCDVIMKETDVCAGLRIVNERVLWRVMCDQSSGQDLQKTKAAGLLGRMYAPSTYHPSVAYRQSPDKKNELWPVKFPPEGSPGSPLAFIPLLEKNPPLTFQVVKNITGDHQLSVNAGAKVFYTRYVSDRQVLQGLVLKETLSGEGAISPLTELIVEVASKQLGRIQEAVSLLASEHRDEKKKKTTSLAWKRDQLMSLRHNLWQAASEILNRERIDNGLANDELKNAILMRFKKIALREWHKTLSCRPSPSSMSERYREYEATCNVLGVDKMTEPNDADSPSMQPRIMAGRKFAETFDNLTAGERASLQHAQSPTTTRFFWDCMNQALREDPHAYFKLYEEMIPLFAQATPVEDTHNVGHVLSRFKQHVHPRRIEDFFLEDQQKMVIDSLGQIFSLIKSRTGHKAIKLDFGILVQDLTDFRFRHDMVLRRWAESFFRNKSDRPAVQPSDASTQNA